MSADLPSITPRRYPTEPWGRYRPNGFVRGLIELCRSIPAAPVVKQLVFPLRSLARLGMEGAVDHRLWGHRLRFRPRGNVAEARLLFLPDRWDDRERHRLTAYLEPGAVFVDVGANFGGYTWWVLSRLGHDVRVVALEPDPELREALTFNLRTNGFENVTVLEVAAGAGTGTAELHIHPTNRGQNSLIPGADTTGARSVRVRPLADILADAGLDRVDALKIDIEGMEGPVLDAFFRDAPRSLWPRTLLSEWKDTESHTMMRSRLEQVGYRVELETGMNILARLTSAAPESTE